MFDYRFSCFFFFQAEDGIRDLVRSRGLGDVYKRQTLINVDPRGRKHYQRRRQMLRIVEPIIVALILLLSLIHI